MITEIINKICDANSDSFSDAEFAFRIFGCFRAEAVEWRDTTTFCTRIFYTLLNKLKINIRLLSLFTVLKSFLFNSNINHFSDTLDE